jgi:hypothetical protein
MIIPVRDIILQVMRISRNGRYERALKHLIIAANLGCDDSIQRLKECYAMNVSAKGTL